MKKTRLILIALAFTLMIQTEAKAQWVTANTGLTVQDANSFAKIGSNLFVGTGNISGNGQGVFKSTDNGATWSPVNTGLTNLNVQQLIASGTNLFAAIGASGPPDGGVFLSTDNGASWNPVNNGLTYAHAYNIAVLGSTLYVSSVPSTVFSSTDNGANWTAVTDPILVASRVKSIIQAGSNMLVASDLGTNAGVMLSTNGGTSWSTTSITGETDDLQLIGNVVYAAVGDGGVFRSFDNGVTWDSVGVPTHNATALEAVDTMLIAGTPYGAYSSCDRGVTWTDISVGAGGANLSIEAFGIDANNIYIGNTFHSVGVYSRPVTELSCDPNAGIEGSNMLGDFRVYPNPTFGVLQIVSNNPLSIQSYVEVYNMQGEMIERKFNCSQIDLTNLPNGMYTIKIFDGNSYYSTKIIKE